MDPCVHSSIDYFILEIIINVLIQTYLYCRLVYTFWNRYHLYYGSPYTFQYRLIYSIDQYTQYTVFFVLLKTSNLNFRNLLQFYLHSFISYVQKERDLELAARIGQTLLSKNKELSNRTDILEEQLLHANDKVSSYNLIKSTQIIPNTFLVFLRPEVQHAVIRSFLKINLIKRAHNQTNILEKYFCFQFPRINFAQQ